MSKNITISALVLSIAIISAQSPAQASVNSETFENIQTENNVNFVKLDIGHQLLKSTAFSSDAEPMQVAGIGMHEIGGSGSAINLLNGARLAPSLRIKGRGIRVYRNLQPTATVKRR